jgi:hypothetical protein
LILSGMATCAARPVYLVMVRVPDLSL